MKCFLRLNLFVFLFGCLCAVATAQPTPLVMEYQGSVFGVGLFDDPWESALNAGALDYNGDGKKDLVIRVGQNLVVRIFGEQQTYLLLSDDVPDPSFSLNKHRFAGFYDVAGSSEKEMILLPVNGAIPDSIIPCYAFGLGANNRFEARYIGPPGLYLAPRNFDGDSKFEIPLLVGNPFGLGGSVSVGILGEGFTPGLLEENGGDDGFSAACSGNLTNFMLQRALAPNLRWPGNGSFLPAGSNDFDGDNFPDIAHPPKWPPDSVCCPEEVRIIIISSKNQQPLYDAYIPMPATLQTKTFKRVFYHDFCGNGSKQILFMGSDVGLNLRDMEIILIHDPQTGETGQILQSFLENQFSPLCVCDLAEMLGVTGSSLVMEHKTTGRLIVVGPGDGLWGGNDDEFIPPSLEDRSAGYSLQKIWESITPASLTLPLKNSFSLQDFDINEDGKLDFPGFILQDSASTLITGFYAINGATGDFLWQTSFPDALTLNEFSEFLGFYDANGDGEKEMFFGKNKVQTADGQRYTPFEPGFVMRAILDVDGDGYAEIIGESAEAKVQVWGKKSSTSTMEQLQNNIGAITISPNPSKGQFRLSWMQESSEELRFELFNEAGQKAFSVSLGAVAPGLQLREIALDAQLPPGLYLGRLCGEKACKPVFISLY